MKTGCYQVRPLGSPRGVKDGKRNLNLKSKQPNLYRNNREISSINCMLNIKFIIFLMLMMMTIAFYAKNAEFENVYDIFNAFFY